MEYKMEKIVVRSNRPRFESQLHPSLTVRIEKQIISPPSAPASLFIKWVPHQLPSNLTGWGESKDERLKKNTVLETVCISFIFCFIILSSSCGSLGDGGSICVGARGAGGMMYISGFFSTQRASSMAASWTFVPLLSKRGMNAVGEASGKQSTRPCSRGPPGFTRPRLGDKRCAVPIACPRERRPWAGMLWT